jgi:hypothetical protein
MASGPSSKSTETSSVEPCGVLVACITPTKASVNVADAYGSPGVSGDLHSVAKRIPTSLKKSADPNANRRREINRGCLIKAVDYLMKHEEQAQSIWNMICQDMVPSNVSDRAGYFAFAVKCLKKLPTAFKAEWISSRSEDSLSIADMQAIE